jgi:membrane protease YdiL (CAAX protease family)
MTSVRAFSERYDIALYFVLAYAISWAAWAPLVVSPVGATAGAAPLIIAGGFGPLVSAVLVTWLSGGSLRAWAAQIARWRVGTRWYLVALFLPVGVMLLASGVHILLGGMVDLSGAPPVYLFIVGVLMATVLTGGQEEPGWRGFALPRLQERTSALGASLILGVLHAGWHLPLFAVPVSSQANLPLGLYLLWVVGLTVVFTWIYNNTGGSVLLTMIFHAAANTTTAWYLIGGAVGAQSPLAQTSFVVAIWIVALTVILVYGAANLVRERAPST